MNKESIMLSYLDALHRGATEEIIALFAPDGIVESPLYGTVEASRFYREVDSDTSNSEPELKNLFLSHDDSASGAMQFLYRWTMKSRAIVAFNCIDVFEFEGEPPRIKKLTIVYDTYPVRESFSALKKA